VDPGCGQCFCRWFDLAQVQDQQCRYRNRRGQRNGGDDAGAVPFWALDRNEFVFGELPEAVSISIQYLQHRKVAVPLNLEITLGL
jgi:hypothetical protein